MFSTEVVGQQFETVRHVQALAGGVFGHGFERILRGDFAQAHRARVAVEQRTKLGQEGQIFGLGVVVIVVLKGVGVVGAEAAADTLCRRLGRVVAQQPVVKTEVDGVQAQAIDTAIQPETHHIQYRGTHVGIVEVEIGLRGQKIVQVILAAARLPLPRDTPEYGQPVVGRAAIGLGIGPHVPVGFRIVAAAAAFLEPRVLDRVVAEHLVDHHLQAKTMRLGQQTVEIGQGAEQRVHRAVVGDVVAEVGHRRLEKRRDPDRIDAQACHVIEAIDDAGQVADAVAIGIDEAARVDLVNRRAAPPWRLVGGQAIGRR